MTTFFLAAAWLTWSVPAAAPQDADAATQPAVSPYLAQSPQVVSLSLMDDTWTFASIPGASGLRVSRGAEGAAGFIDLNGDGELGRILSFDVTARQNSPTSAFIGVAVAALAADGVSVEYRFLFGRTYGSADNLLDEGSWSYSAPLITRPAQTPFIAMSVNLLGGDSILVTLQDVKRTPNGDTFETHRFVHHCPQAGKRLAQSRHYADGVDEAR